MPIVVEDVSGRSLMVAPGDVFLATPGHRESTRWVVGGIPPGGLVPDENYWVLAQAGIIGDFVGDSPRSKGHLGKVKYLGAVRIQGDENLNIRDFAIRSETGISDPATLLYVVLGTSAEVGKTTAAIGIIRSLLQSGHRTVVVLKATGTSSISELLAYRDFGAAHAFDCVDFGLPTTYPSNRVGMERTFDLAIEFCLCMPADAVIVECGGDFLGANVPVFLQRLKGRRSGKIVLAAADALGALGGKLMLCDMGFPVDLITGLCTDTPTLRQRTEDLCGIPAINMARGKHEHIDFDYIR